MGKTTKKELKKELERTRVQLAGCSAAALVGETIPKDCYGWSASYQDVLELRNYAVKLEKTLVKTEEDLLKTKLTNNAVYSERNKLVALLSIFFPGSLERHQPENDHWEDDWRWVVFLELPDGQLISWHIHDSELPLFAHLPRNQGRKWDGHSIEEKYQRLANFMKKYDISVELVDENRILSSWQPPL